MAVDHHSGATNISDAMMLSKLGSSRHSGPDSP
eukprot:CAMPEP_0114256004 /NCGR_PEP_ID=MMETSP0058-20121206/17894_1 /TAXON_ID=36894 /ORGANISM="Pyramimonas parkeae, CCMP726" /LENGTH=32 /DNA_ID= /DNA_START= /DNA_END= /DNA_ORIENTATION=